MEVAFLILLLISPGACFFTSDCFKKSNTNLRRLNNIKISMRTADQVETQIEAQLREKYPEKSSITFDRRSQINIDGDILFYKVGTGGASAELRLLEYEAEGLQRLADTAKGLILVPRPWLTGVVNRGGGGQSSGFIVMDQLSMGNRRGSDSQVQLGTGLATIHLAPSTWKDGRFGFPMDGCCGALAQPNNPEAKEMNWCEFWAEYRLNFQLSQCRSCSAIQEAGAKLLPRLGVLFDGLEDVQPSLLHGDLWSGNHGVANTNDGQCLPCIFDPACYYGHDEADFGIAHMFGGLSEEFYEAYFELRPKRDGFEERALLYELHHHLNHLNIFGRSYEGGALRLMNQLLKIVI